MRQIQIECKFTRDRTLECSGGDIYSRLVVSAYVGTRVPKCQYVALNDDGNCLVPAGCPKGLL